jgi:hypothetical protein
MGCIATHARKVLLKRGLQQQTPTKRDQPPCREKRGYKSKGAIYYERGQKVTIA